MYIIWGSIKTDYNYKKSENRKIGNRKIENRKIGNFQNRKISKPIPNHGANACLKGEPVAVGDLKASLSNVLLFLVTLLLTLALPLIMALLLLRKHLLSLSFFFYAPLVTNAFVF